MHLFLKLLFTAFFISITSHSLFSQTPDITTLEKEVLHLNDTYQYLTSLQKIDSYIDHTDNQYEIYQAYLLKSYTYKRLFNYEDALKSLNTAHQHGIASDKSQEVEATVKSEKAFIYFDIHDYSQAEKLMQELREDNFRHISGPAQSFIVMQEGYVFYLKKEYPKAEELLLQSIDLMNQHQPRNLPMVYGKLVELYNETKQFDKRDESFQKGLALAKERKILKYEMYMYEMLIKSFEHNGQYKDAFLYDKILDSLKKEYDRENHITQLKIYEKNSELKEKDYQLRKQKTVRNFLIVIILILIALAFISYKLLQSKKKEHLLLEKEYDRIYQELALLAQEKNETGNKISIDSYDLTPRQLEIIEHLKSGKTNKQIAAELHISENTVKYHIKSIYEILQVDSRMKLFKLLKG